ncbi:MAG TPA: hypothetical protein VEG34_10510 [Thermoanaerobaculia bacterium]|nr:hypothetical protein [Thermoanaerobaculia bacterium]
MARHPEPPADDFHWASEILKRYPSGVDESQLEERLRLTPTERLERMRRFLEFLEEVKRPSGR